jgi:hypothetical protein
VGHEVGHLGAGAEIQAPDGAQGCSHGQEAREEACDCSNKEASEETYDGASEETYDGASEEACQETRRQEAGDPNPSQEAGEETYDGASKEACQETRCQEAGEETYDGASEEACQETRRQEASQPSCTQPPQRFFEPEPDVVNPRPHVVNTGSYLVNAGSGKQPHSHQSCEASDGESHSHQLQSACPRALTETTSCV